MSRAVTLRLQDVRRAFRVIGDCRDVGDDTDHWQEWPCRASVESFVRSASPEARAAGSVRCVRLLQCRLTVGLDPAAKRLLSAYMRDFGVNADPIFQSLQLRPGRLVTQRRGELVPEASGTGRADLPITAVGPASIIS